MKYQSPINLNRLKRKSLNGTLNPMPPDDPKSSIPEQESAIPISHTSTS